MLQEPRALGVRGALAPPLILLIVLVVVSEATFCPRCPATTDFLERTKLQIIWMKRSVQDLYASYVNRMDLLDLRSFCESTPVAWFPSRTITKKPGSLMVQDLYRTFTNVEGSLIVLKELQHSYNPEDSLYHKLDKSSILVAGLLSNIRCAICLQSRTPTTFTPRKRTLVVSDFYRKTAGCRVLWNYSKFVAHLARVFRKEFDPGKKPRRPKKRSRLGHTASFSLTHQN